MMKTDSPTNPPEQLDCTEYVLVYSYPFQYLHVRRVAREALTVLTGLNDSAECRGAGSNSP